MWLWVLPETHPESDLPVMKTYPSSKKTVIYVPSAHPILLWIKTLVYPEKHLANDGKWMFTLKMYHSAAFKTRNVIATVGLRMGFPFMRILHERSKFIKPLQWPINQGIGSLLLWWLGGAVEVINGYTTIYQNYIEGLPGYIPRYPKLWGLKCHS